jgi:hypothetical protein
MPASGQHILASRFPPFETNEKKMKRSGLQERSEGTINGVTISPGLERLCGQPNRRYTFSLRKNMENPDVGVLIMEKKLGHPAW